MLVATGIIPSPSAFYRPPILPNVPTVARILRFLAGVGGAAPQVAGPVTGHLKWLILLRFPSNPPSAA